MQTIWNSNYCSVHGQFYFFYYPIKAYCFPYHLQTDQSRLTIGLRADMSNENIKQLKNSIRDEQDTSCHRSHHIRQMYKGMIAHISPLGNSWWLIFNEIEKSKRHEKSWDLRCGNANLWLDEMSLKIQDLNVTVTSSAIVIRQHVLSGCSWIYQSR